MKKWITCLVATGLLATTAFVTTAADNVTITLGTNTTASTFNVLDNASTVLLNVTAGDNQTMAKRIRVEDNLSVYGSIGGAGRASAFSADVTMSPGDNSTVVIMDNGAFPSFPHTVTLPTATGSGIIYTIYNADDDNISVYGPGGANGPAAITPINPAHGQGGEDDQTHQVAPGTKTDCVDVGGNIGGYNGWKCFSY